MATKTSKQTSTYNPEEIKIRRVNFSFDKKNPRFYYKNNPFSTHFINALHIVFPTGERFFVNAVLKHRHEIEDEKFGNVGHRELGRGLSYYGNWKGAEQELNISEKAFKKIKQPQSQSVSLAYLSLNSLLHHRSQSKEDLIQTASNYARQSLALAEGGDPNIGGAVVSRDLVRSRWLLGAAFRANNELTLAEENLFKALNLCRQINMVDHEANILLDLARLRYAQGDFKDAQEKASEALVITERSGYVLQGADVNLFLAQYALEQEKDKAKAKAYAESALKLAYCDGPPYYYKVAYEEADVFLKT